MQSSDDEVVVTASSIEELLRKVQNVIYESLSDSVMTDEEKQVGGFIDYRG